MSWHVPSHGIQCFGADCPNLLPEDFIHQLCPKLCDLDCRSEPAHLDLGSQLQVMRLKRSILSKSIVWPRDGKNIGCPLCGKECIALLRNQPCHHAVCEDCWVSWMEESVASCEAKCMLNLVTKCIKKGCKMHLNSDLARFAAERSDLITRFYSKVRSEVARLKCTADDMLVWGNETLGGPICPVCKTQRYALLANPNCSHAACEGCWMAWCEEQVPRCRAQALNMFAAPCIDPECTCEIDATIPNHVRTISVDVAKFLKNVKDELSRLGKCTGQVLDLGLCPSEAGPECPVCRERCLALLRNPDCSHAACEDCWASWFSTQLRRCTAEKRASVVCFAPGCQCPAASALWSHSCTRNDHVSHMEMRLAFRRRLQSNPLYPQEVQVECPSNNCVGLGYTGYDTVMCFVCEQQWPADGSSISGAAPLPDMSIEMPDGEVMKQCPCCGEYIIKNGGCDHMTCRCRHEFWWSTLLPYRNS